MKRLFLLALVWAGLSACNAPGPERGSQTAEAAEVELPASDTLTAGLAAGGDAPTAPRKTIADYYRALTEPYAPRYALQQAGKEWYTVSELGDTLPVLVDAANGYLQLVDDGTGGGTIEVELALFRLASGQPMVAVSQKYYDGVGMQQELFCLRPEDGQQLDWTEHSLPVLTAYDFLQPGYEPEADIAEAALPVVVALPRKGTTAKAEAFTGMQYIYCNDGAPEEYSAYCEVYKHLARQSIGLRWDRELGAFVVVE